MERGGAARRAERSARSVAELLFIVARDRQDLYASLRHTFVEDPSVRVLVDRRSRERRQRQEPPSLERRRADRRERPEAETQLCARGWALVSRSSAAPEASP